MEAGRKFHITVGAASANTSGGEISLRKEVELVKAALLYGDQAALCSPTCTLVLSMAMLGNAGAQAAPVEQLRTFRQVFAPIIPKSTLQALDVIERVKAKKYRGTRENIVLSQLEQEIARGWNEIRDKLFELAQASGLDELLEARAAGLLELYSADDVPGLTAENVTDAVLNDFLSRINAAVSGTKSYALLDAGAGELVRLQISEGQLKVPDAMIGRGRHMALAGDLLSRLPHFSAATLTEIIDIRRELEQPLKRFRRAILDYSDRISCSPWEEAFNVESDRVFIRDIEPAVLEIEEAVKSRPYMQALVARYVKSKGDFLLPAVPPAVAPVLSLFAADTQVLIAIAAALVGAAHVSAVLSDVRNEVRKAHRPEQHQLFFYYRAKQLLQ